MSNFIKLTQVQRLFDTDKGYYTQLSPIYVQYCSVISIEPTTAGDTQRAGGQSLVRVQDTTVLVPVMETPEEVMKLVHDAMGYDVIAQMTEESAPGEAT